MKENRKFMTLVEIMIVMFLITIIAGMATYKIKDSIDYGKAFKTHQNIIQLKQALQLACTKNPPETVQANWPQYAQNSLFFNRSNDITKDGWGCLFDDVKVYERSENGYAQVIVAVSSTKFESYKENHDVWFEEEE